MAKLRMTTGVVSMLCLALALNVLIFTKDVFTVPVLLLFGAAIITGVTWIALTLAGIARYAQHEGTSLYGLNTIASALLFLGVCIAIYAFAAHSQRSWDLTREGRRSLAPQTVQVLESLTKDVGVICFFLQVDDRLVRIAKDKTERFLEQCQRHTQHLNVRFLDPQVAKGQLEALNISHASTQGTVVMKCGARQRVITLGGASPRLEEREFTNALINIVRRSRPKIYFLTGHGERDIMNEDERDGGSMMKVLLETEAYETERLGLSVTNPEMPDDCDILVLNGLGLQGPKADLHPNEIRVIQEYLDRGGRMLILIDPWIRASKAPNQREQLRPWLDRRYGIVVGDNVVLSPDTTFSVELATSARPFEDQGQEEPFQGCFNAKHPITRGFGQKMAMSVARTVEVSADAPSDTTGTVLLRTTPEFWAETDLDMLLKTKQVHQESDEPQKPQHLAVAVTAQTDMPASEDNPPRNARLVVVGDSDLASNDRLGVIPGNLNFMLNVFAWLSENEELIAIRPSGKEESPIILSEAEERTIVWVSVLLTLQVVVAAGIVVHLARRRYR